MDQEGLRHALSNYAPSFRFTGQGVVMHHNLAAEAGESAEELRQWIAAQFVNTDDTSQASMILETLAMCVSLYFDNPAMGLVKVALNNYLIQVVPVEYVYEDHQWRIVEVVSHEVPIDKDGLQHVLITSAHKITVPNWEPSQLVKVSQE